MILDNGKIELCGFSLFGQVRVNIAIVGLLHWTPHESSSQLLSIPQARKRLPGLQTSILNCSKTLLPLLPIQINWKSRTNLPVKAEISNYASVGIFMILGVVVWNGWWVFTYACCSYDL